MRILITGSQTWTNYHLIATVLRDLDQGRLPGQVWTMVSGACPRGADAICERVARRLGWKVERHPADWEHYGKRAGLIRNEHMVETGADTCLAFIAPCDKLDCDRPQPHGSHGASHTADLAEKAGIHTERFEP